MINSLRDVSVKCYYDYPLNKIEPRKDWIFGPYSA